MKRRTFFKFGGTLAALSMVSKARAGEVLTETEERPGKKPVIISTWNFGKAANNEAWTLLNKKGSALDAVEAAAVFTENDLTNRSVGLGGFPDSAGKVTLDACIMDSTGNCGSVAFLSGYKNPIKVARGVMQQTPHVMLVGSGAEKFAKAKGFEKGKSPDQVKKDYKNWKRNSKETRIPEINLENHDTIGILALDSQGLLAGACTTSGWAYKMEGRVGDAPLIGSGLFVDQEVGAACATGLGEEIIKINGSHTVVELMRQGYSPQSACKLAADRLVRRFKLSGGDIKFVQCAFIALNKYGEYGGYSIQNGFQYAVKSLKEDTLIDSEFLSV